MYDTSFLDEARTFYINVDGFENFPIVTMGRKSYIVSANIEAGIIGVSTSLIIGNFCAIAHSVNFLINLNHDYLYASTYPIFNFCTEWKQDENIKKGQIIAGNDVWIGRNATILDGITIGNGAVIVANFVITKDAPPYTIIAENPAKIKKYRFSDDIIIKLNTIKWWYWDCEKILKKQRFFY